MLAAELSTEREPLSASGGGSITCCIYYVEVTPQRLEQLHEMVPRANLVLLINPTNPFGVHETKSAQVAAHALGMQLQVLHASNENDETQAPWFPAYGSPRTSGYPAHYPQGE
jgi:hypothetical protein